MIVELVEKIAAELAARNVTADVVYGKDTPARENAGFRVAFFARAFTFGPREAQKSNARVIASRRTTLEVHCWAKAATHPDPTLQEAADDDAALALADATLATMRKVFSGNGAGEGNGTMTIDTRTVAYGAEAVFTVWVGSPVADAPWPVLPAGTVVLEHQGFQVNPAGTAAAEGC